VPPEFSRAYAARKKKAGEAAELIEIPRAGHFDLIDPASKAFEQVRSVVLIAADLEGD
jgi:pimeloyl-ACP methyl ester carboxylesterase